MSPRIRRQNGRCSNSGRVFQGSTGMISSSMTGIESTQETLDAAVTAMGVKVLRTPFRSPQANAVCERLEEHCPEASSQEDFGMKTREHPHARSSSFGSLGNPAALDSPVRFELQTLNASDAHRAKSLAWPCSVQNRSTNWLKYSWLASSSFIFCKPHPRCRSTRLG
jgi:hypothetical protein